MKDRYIGITQPLNIVSRAYANLDAKYGPYNSIENALENIPMSLRVQGLTVGIITDNEIKEYWFKSGIENTDLIEKSDADLTSVFQALANKVDKEVGSFLMTQEERDLLEILGGPGGTIDIDALKGLFLSKVIDDIAKGKITFEKGLTSQDLTRLLETRFGEFSSGINTGKGGRIDEDGHGELESLIVRSFLEVPELRYNRLTLVGEEIAVGAGGIIEDVIPYNTGYRITLKLEEGEMNPFWYDDIVKGIYHHDNGFKTTWFRVVSPTDATRNTIDIVMRASSGNITYPIPVPFMHIARWGNFNSNPSFVDNRNRQSVLVLSSKTGSITFYDGIDNYGNGYVNSQWGKPAGLEFINNFENLPIGQHDPVLYLRTLLVQDIFKVNHEGYQVTEYRDRGIWDLDVATGDTPYESTLSLQDEVWHNKSKYRCIEHHTTEEPAQDSPYWLFLFELGDGEAGQSSFKSTVFKRTNTTLTTAPTGGDYGSPKPTTGGWTDGIPAGEEKLWASSRIFTSDGLTPQQDEWSIPRFLTDTANLELQYSSEEIPGTPTNSPDKWSSTSRVNTIWMATRTKKNGVWSTWTILQIKGETGAKGDDGTSVVIKGKVDNPSELPSPPDVSVGDGYISEDIGDLWVYDGSTEESGATLGWLNVGQIQGDSSYIHIAWADEVIFNAENIFLNVIGFTLIDTNKKRWYGIYVDNLKEDANQANAHKYNWVDTKGEPGKDSHSDEFIYIRNNDANFGVAENIPNSENTIDYIPPGDWTDDPVGVTSSLKYEWVCTRKFRDEAWGAFSIPSIWNIFVTDGADGKDSKSDEFIFKVNNISNFNQAINRPPNDEQTDDFVPTGWTDDPTGPTITDAYEWVCKRVFNTNTQTWSTFSIPSLWAKYSKDGADGDVTAVATPYMAGEWEGEKIGSTWASTRQYKRTASSYPVVSWLKGPLDKPIYYFLKKEVTVDVGANSPNLDTENWRLADGYEMVITEAILSNFAKLGSFIFNGRSMISQQGVIEGAYSEEYTEDEFIPYFRVNGETGRLDARYAFIEGKIIATEGEIGGFKIQEGKIDTPEAGLSGVAGVRKDNPAFWAGGTYEQAIGGTAKAIIRHDGTSKFSDTDITGTVNATSGVFTGALASPFERTKSTYTKDFSNNLIVTGGTFILPWDQLGSGRLIRLIQPHPGTPYCTAPTGKYFYEDGEQKNTLTMLGAEIIELLGYTDGHGNFTGWLVLNRGLLHTASTWGEPHRIVAHGRVKTNSPFKYHTFDGSTLTTSTSEFDSRKYTSIIMPEKWFDRIDGYYVKIIANGGDSAAFHTVVKNTHYAFAVYQHSLNVANGTLSPTTTFDFYFEVYSAAWLYPKTGAVELPGVAW